jgi:hypothetical protein
LGVKSDEATAAHALEALAVAVAARAPVLLWGSPGSGKSSALAALGETLGVHVEVVLASIREPSDFAGLPVIDGGRVRLAAPDWAAALVAAGGGILFFDEISTAPPAVQAALLRVCLERIVGDTRLPAETAIVAAANSATEASDSWDLTAPLSNRFVHLPWSLSPQQFAAGMLGSWPEPPKVDLGDCSGVLFRDARAAVANFVLARPSLLSQVPSGAGASSPWPSPRSWEMAARLYAAALAAGVSRQARDLLLAGSVGAGPAAEFLGWAAAGDLLDPADVLADPDGAPLPQRSDRLMALLQAVVRLAAERADSDTWMAAWQVLDRAADSTPDVAAMAARDLSRARPEGAPVPSAALDRFFPLFRTADLV